MPLPTDSTDWLRFLEEAWSAESLGSEPPGLVVKTDDELWKLWRVATDSELRLEIFDIWLSGLSSRDSQRATLDGTVAASLGLSKLIQGELEAGAVRHCAKCNGTMANVRWREATIAAQQNFPELRFSCVEPIQILKDDKLKASFNLEKYLEILGSERVVLDGKLVGRGALQPDLLNSPLSKSSKWHEELKVVLATEPEETWVGEIIGVNTNREVVFRQEIDRGSVCNTCGRAENCAFFSAYYFARDSVKDLKHWHWQENKLSEVLDWTVGELVAEFKLQNELNLELLSSLGLIELKAFASVGGLDRATAFSLWAYIFSVQRGGRDLLAFDVPKAVDAAGRALLLDLLRSSGSRLFTDRFSQQRFFAAGGGKNVSHYRCIWGRARGSLARRIGVFDGVVSPFFATEEGRLSGVRTANFSSIGCRRCEDKFCKSCGGSGIQERYWGLKYAGISLKNFMCLPISSALKIPGIEELRGILEKLVSLGFGALSLGTAEMVRTSPAWSGYEAYVADLLAGRLRGGWEEIEELLS